MFSFLHIKIYKNMFLRYLLAIVLLSAAACCIALKMQYDNQLKQFSDTSLEAFSRMEHEMDKYTSEGIDDYISKLYSNKMLLSDFLSIFQSDADSYYAGRVQQAEDASFISDFKLFVKSNNYVVSKVIFNTPNMINEINYYENRSPNFLFNVPANQLDIRYDDISYGYPYTKKITDPQNYSIDLGKVIFVMNTSKIMSAVKQYDIDSACAVSKNGILHLTNTNFDISDETLLSFYQLDDTQQIISYGLFNRTYCYIHTSSRYGYKFVAAESSEQIIKKCLPSFLFTVTLILSVCLMILVVTVLNIQKDSKMLTKIITFIDYASTGEFSEIQFRKHNDEYFLIANKLNKMGKNIKMYIEHEYLFKLDQQKAEMKALQNQINPHFLYNTLEIIRYRALKNSDPEVSDAIENLGSLYRSIVKAENIITLDQELSILQQYLKLMQFRYTDNFCYQINVPEDIRQFPTVKFWMQPVVENFFKYGFDKSSEYNVFFVIGFEKNGLIQLELSNNGCPISADKLKKINDLLNKDGQEQTSESIGLQNVYRRLRFFYGESFSMKIANNQPSGVTTIIRFSRDVLQKNLGTPVNEKSEE